MGFFSRIRDGMNEEFVIGQSNVRRYEEDPTSLAEILAEQRARGIGSARALREHARGQAAARAKRPRLLDRLAQAALIAGLGLLAAHLWNRGND